MATLSIEQSVKATIVHGFYVSYLVVFFLAFSVDVMSENYLDSRIDAVAWLSALFGIWFYRKYKNVKFSSYLALLIGALSIIALTYIGGFGNYDAVFMVVFALSFFFMLEYKEALVLSFIFYSIEIALMVFIARSSVNDPLLDNTESLSNIFLSTVFIIMFGLYYHFTIRRAYQALEKSNRQKELLIKEVHHRVKNNLNVIISMLSLQAESNYTNASEALLSSRDRVASIALVHESLYKSEDLEFIHIDNYLSSLIGNIQALYDREKKIEIKLSINNITMELNRALFIGLIMNELLVNSYKHAFKSSLNPCVNISFEERSDDYFFSFSDNGVGVEENFSLENQVNIGSKFVLIALGQVEGESRIYNKDGLHYEITFPRTIDEH